MKKCLFKKMICSICKEKIGFFEKKKEIKSISEKRAYAHPNCIIKNPKGNTEVNEAIKNVKISQIKECLKTKAYCTYTPTEIAELGFSEKDIEKIVGNNYNEMVRLVRYTNTELLKMGFPMSEIKNLRNIYRKMENFEKKLQEQK